MTGRRRFLDACAGRWVDRPPVWLMRQAGRALPEYRALKEKRTFVELVQTPELATEVTLQPIRRFGFDAAVIFSDILVAAEAMGQGYRFKDEGGIEMAFPIRTAADVDRLTVSAVEERLGYLGEAIRRVRGELGDGTAVLGFAGSPWTLANFMMERSGGGGFQRAKALYYSDRPLFDRLLGMITETVIRLLRLQIEAGADAVQLFDTLGELLPAAAYPGASARWVREILNGLPGGVPVILYVRGAPTAFQALAGSGLGAFSVDWREDLAGLRARLPSSVALQGNLDPELMLTTPEVVAAETRRILESMRGQRGFIFNLGHGLPPGATLGNIEALVTTVKRFSHPAGS